MTVERIAFEPIGSLDALGQRWHALEAEADGGFFRSWAFLGCQVAQRFSGASLLSVTQDGADVALGLFGSAHGQLWLNQTGSAALDAPFIERNGLLIRRGQQHSAARALRHVAQSAQATVLSGIDDATMEAAREAGWLVLDQSRFAPCVDLLALSRPYLDTISANARAQIRRSQRSYGPDLHLARAQTLSQAQDWFEQLVALHQASWNRRGHTGAFGTPETRRFHETLIDRAWSQGEVDLLRIAAGGQVVGLLYTFVQDGRVLSYQSGFAYNPGRPREKPGLVCHALAIEYYAGRGARIYDLLAGADRYKRSLAQGGETLHWATLYRRWSGSGALALAKAKTRSQPWTGPVKACLA